MVMNAAMEYFEMMQHLVTQITNNNNSVLLFGCGKLGVYAKQTLEYFGIYASCYIDNNVDKQNTFFCDLPVISVHDAITNFPNVYVCVCIFKDAIEDIVNKQLQQAGFTNFIDKNMIIHLYLSENIKPLGYKISGNKISSPAHLSFIITEKCSLNCRYCSHYIPYRKNPKQYSREECLKIITKACKVIDEIYCLSVYGGEIFMHPQATEICTDIAQFNEIKTIEIITNATIVPPEKFWQIISQSQKFFFTISDYRVVKSSVNELVSLCGKYNVKYNFVLEGKEWDEIHLPEPHNRTLAENRAVYCCCPSNETCPGIIDGKIYKCVAAFAHERIGLVPYCEDDVVNLLDESLSIEVLREQMKKFILSTDAITACDYCYQGILKSVPKAEQILDGDFSLETLKKHLGK